MDKTAWQDPPYSCGCSSRSDERARDRKRMARIEAKLDQLLGNVKAPGVRVYDAEGVDVTDGFELTLDFSGHKLKFRRPPTAEEVVESLQVMRLLTDVPHHLYTQDPHTPAKYNRRMPTELLSRSCKIQAQQVVEAVPV